MSISFAAVPQSLRVPMFAAELDASAAAQSSASLSALLIGQRLSTGAVAAHVPTLIASEAQAILAFGRGSMLAAMVARFRAANPLGRLWCIAEDDDGAGVKATGTVTITGPATAAGALSLYVAGRLVEVAVASGDANTTIAAALNTKIAAMPDLPVVSTVLLGVVTIEARHKGLLGNGIDLRLNYAGAAAGEKLPAGVGATIVAMAAGVTDPSIVSSISAIQNIGGLEVVGTAYAATTPLNLLKAEFDDASGRWSYLRAQYGHVVCTNTAVSGTLQSTGDARNNQHETIFGVYRSPTPPWEITAAAAGAIFASVESDPARPLQTLALPGVVAPAMSDQFTITERQSLLMDGIATLTFDGDGTARIERAITTYQENPAGADDTAYLDSETLYTLAYILRAMKSRIQTRYPRHKLVNDGTRYGAGQAVVTPAVIKGEILAMYRELETAAIVENFAAFKAALIVERNALNPNRVDVLFPPDLANQLRIFAVLAQFRLQY